MSEDGAAATGTGGGVAGDVPGVEVDVSAEGPAARAPARAMGSAIDITTPDRVLLAGQQDGGAPGAPAIVLLHGLTATRRYVVMGSRLLQRSGYRVIAYDARGHGQSAPAPRPDAYGYEQLADDLAAVLDTLGIARAALAGASMGAHTILRFALRHPERVAALGIVTPAFDPDAAPGAGPEGDRAALARGLRAGGVEGFLAAYDFSRVPPAWRETVERVVRQRLAAHAHPDAVADALEGVSRSRPFESIDELARIAIPAVVVASRDEVDPGHPLALAERYAAAIPGAALTVEDGGPPARSPIAWQGGQLSRVLLELLARARWER
ncbi:MAG TPA: alpha/beta hydrolase [Solirubrobacteraceae bacterium]|nr:alpha/beta hydrolase [Solirubrobacteraceae bacterium]